MLVHALGCNRLIIRDNRSGNTRSGIQLFRHSFSTSHQVKFSGQFHAPSCFLKDRTQVPIEQQAVRDLVVI
jgi:hypothetical protein